MIMAAEERFHVDFVFRGEVVRVAAVRDGRPTKVTTSDDVDAAAWPRARAAEICSRLAAYEGRLVPAVTASAKTRGRFYIIREDGWTLVDDKWKGLVSFGTKAEAQSFKTFAIAYTRRWGDINFYSFPMDIEHKPMRIDLADAAIDDANEAPTWDAIDDEVRPDVKVEPRLRER